MATVIESTFPTPVERQVAVPTSYMRRISWGAVLGGVVIAIIIQVTMNMLGLAVGAGALEPGTPQPNIGPALGTGFVIWISASTLLGIFAGGWVAGHLAGSPDKTDGLLHGLLTWAVGTFIMLMLLGSSASNVVNGVSNALGQGLGLLGASVADVAPEVAEALELQESTLATIREEVNTLPTEEDASIGVELPIAVAELLRQDADSANATETRDAVVTMLTEQTSLTRPEAEQQVADWETQFQTFVTRAETAAEQAANDIADAIAATAGVLFAVLVIGAFAGGAGGFVGAPETLPTAEVTA